MSNDLRISGWQAPFWILANRLYENLYELSRDEGTEKHE